MKDFLPKGYKVPEPQSRYMRFEEGENKIRILSETLLGWEYWVEDDEGNRKPIRVRTEEELPANIAKTGRDKAKHFWAFIVWNYQLEAIQILELTQVGIQRAIEGLYKSKDWGDVSDYDIIVKKTKTGTRDMDVEYNVIPTPKKKVAKEIEEALIANPINLEALYEGKDPFEVELEQD